MLRPSASSRAVAEQLLAAAVPLDDAVVEVPDADRLARHLDELGHLPQAFLALPQGVLGRPPLRHVDEGDDDAVDPIIDGAVGSQSHQIPAPGPAADFPLDGHEIFDDFGRIIDQAIVGELMGEVGDRPSFVGRGNVEQLGDPRREAVDPHVGIEEQNTEIGRRHQVLQIAVRARHGFQFDLSSALTVCSSSLIDCNSSLLVSSSSDVERYSSLID